MDLARSMDEYSSSVAGRNVHPEKPPAAYISKRQIQPGGAVGVLKFGFCLQLPKEQVYPSHACTLPARKR